MATRVRLKDELLDAQLLRAIGAGAYGGADIGECLAAAGEIDEKDLDSWYRAWQQVGDRVRMLGEAAEFEGQRETARDAYLRACTYYRTSGVMLMGSPVDPRLVASNAQQTAMFRRAAAFFEPPAEVLEIPYAATTLPGYFLRAGDRRSDSAGSSTGAGGSTGDGAGKRATVILMGGYDGTVEELYFFNGAAALARGYSVLMFDGPGQGAALLQQGRKMRPDFESAVSPVGDFALSRDDVDADRIALIGLSLGGQLAPRAASAEHRLAAVLADSGSYDMCAGFLDRLPGPLRSGYEDGHHSARNMISLMLNSVAKKPTAGWSLRRGQLVHGASSPLGYADLLKDYRLQGHAEKIDCPTWIGYAETDEIGASAPELFAALTVADKKLVHFTSAEGAGDHCESAARLLYHARSFGWLDERLQPRRVAS